MTHLPTAFCRSFSFSRAFLLPNSFMASLLSDGWNRAISWSRRSLAKLAGLVIVVGLSSSFGVPYRLMSSPAVSSRKNTVLKLLTEAIRILLSLQSVCLFVCMYVCLFVSRITELLSNKFSRGFASKRYDAEPETITVLTKIFSTRISECETVKLNSHNV